METAEATLSAGRQQIGEAAGAVWRALDEHGPMSYAKLVERVGLSRDIVMQAVGWLAREGKVDISDARRSRMVSLLPE